MRIEITVPEQIKKKAGKYACECQRTGIDLSEKQARIFWIKQLGETVTAGEVLCELETGKVVGEIRSPSAGRLVEICIEDGGACSLGSCLGALETDE